MNEKNYDVVALGELLIDFTENGLSSQGNPLLEANPGGAPCNVLAMLSKLGRKTGFIGKVGQDVFGKQLKAAIAECGIDVSYLQMDESVHTTLAFVHKLDSGDRDFSFYRNPGADMMLVEDEVSEELFTKMKIFHFGTLSMTDEPVRSATKKALELARKNKVCISFDPNLRPPLWKSLELAKEQVLTGLSYCDILKISDNEIQWLTELEDFDEGVQWIQTRYPQIQLILLTLGKEGSCAFYKEFKVQVNGFPQKNTVDTTGAGDTFCGCMLHQVCDTALDQLTPEMLEKMLSFSNMAAAMVTTKRGALRIMPTKEEIDANLM